MTIELEQSNVSIFRTVKVYSTSQNWFGSKNTENTQFDTSIYQTIIDELVVCVSEAKAKTQLVK